MRKMNAFHIKTALNLHKPEWSVMILTSHWPAKYLRYILRVKRYAKVESKAKDFSINNNNVENKNKIL